MVILTDSDGGAADDETLWLVELIKYNRQVSRLQREHVYATMLG